MSGRSKAGMDEQERHDDRARTHPRNIPSVSAEPTSRSRVRLVLKRVFDVGASCFVLVLTVPILLVAALAIKLDSRGPVICRSVRVGRNNVRFEMLRLRSTAVDVDALRSDLEGSSDRSVPLLDVAPEPTVTRVGRVLRATSIDELPQLWNVLRGDMSLIGPRPALPSESESKAPDVAPEPRRVLPGITGIWQVSDRSKAG